MGTKKSFFKKYEFSDGYIVCVRNFSVEEIEKQEEKHGALKKINGMFVLGRGKEKTR